MPLASWRVDAGEDGVPSAAEGLPCVLWPCADVVARRPPCILDVISGLDSCPDWLPDLPPIIRHSTNVRCLLLLCHGCAALAMGD